MCVCVCVYIIPECRINKKNKFNLTLAQHKIENYVSTYDCHTNVILTLKKTMFLVYFSNLLNEWAYKIVRLE